MKKFKKILPFSLLALISLTSCGQTIFGDSYLEPVHFTIELANSHIVDNKLTASFTDRWFFGQIETNKLKDISYSKDALRLTDKFEDYGETISWDTDFPENVPLTAGDDYFLIRDMDYESYNYFKIELQDMTDIQLDYVGGFISVFDDTYMKEDDGGYAKFYKNYTNRSDGLKMRIYFYPKTDEEVKIKNFYHYIINDFYDYILENLTAYLGYYYTTSGGFYGKILHNGSTLNSHLYQLNNLKNDLINNFDDDLAETVKLEGTMSTSDLRNRISHDEDKIIDKFTELIFEAWNNAVLYWKNKYYQTVAEINEARQDIRDNENEISSLNREYDRNIEEINSLRERNEKLEDLIEDASDDESNYRSIANSYYATYSSNVSKAESLEREVSSLELANKLINTQIEGLETLLDNPDLTEEERDAINKQIIALSGKYSINIGKINSLNSEIRQANSLANSAYSNYTYYNNLADSASDRHDQYVEERRDNYSEISSLTSRNNSIKNSLIPACEREINRLENLIEKTLIPRRDDEKDRRDHWEDELASYTLSTNQVINKFDTSRRNYHESLIEKGYLLKAQDLYYNNDNYIKSHGLDQPDIWCFGETSYYFSSTVIKQNDYSSSRHSRADVKSAFVLPFSVVNNSSMNQVDKDSLNTAFENFGTSFTFPEELDNSYCLIKMIYPEYFDETGKWFDDLKISLGNIHFVPSNNTFEEEKNNGVYESWELEMMSNKKSDYSEE